MKKILIALLLLCFALPSMAFVVDYKKDGGAQEHVSKVGFKLLNANQIPYRMNFYLARNYKTINAYTYYSDRSIVLNAEMYVYLQDDNELASVLAHEISHGVDSYQGIFRGTFAYLGNKLNSKKYEYKADKRAVDYMVKAGYNPVAMIVMQNRLFGQGHYDWRRSHPLTSRRLAEVYEYIYNKYPQYLVQNEYKDNIYYQNFLLTSRENRKKLEQKVKSKSKKQVNYL